MQDFNITEDSSRIEKILGTITGDYHGEEGKPTSQIEGLLLKAKKQMVKKTSTLPGLSSYEPKKVESLPETGTEFILYIVPDESSDFSTLYIWIEGKYQSVGTTKIDLSDYPTFDDISKVGRTGRYEDLAGTPIVPTVPDKLSAFKDDVGFAKESDIPKVPTYTLFNDAQNDHVIWLKDSFGHKSYVVTKDTDTVYDDTALRNDFVRDINVVKQNVFTVAKTLNNLAANRGVIEDDLPEFVKVDRLPKVADPTLVYLVKTEEGFDVYAHLGRGFKKLGTTRTDLTALTQIEGTIVFLLMSLYGDQFTEKDS